jgi:hypothetical protein
VNIFKVFASARKGGIQSFQQMPFRDVNHTKWHISGPEKKGQDNWIEASEFRRIYEQVRSEIQFTNGCA